MLKTETRLHYFIFGIPGVVGSLKISKFKVQNESQTDQEKLSNTTFAPTFLPWQFFRR